MISKEKFPNLSKEGEQMKELQYVYKILSNKKCRAELFDHIRWLHEEASKIQYQKWNIKRLLLNKQYRETFTQWFYKELKKLHKKDLQYTRQKILILENKIRHVEQEIACEIDRRLTLILMEKELRKLPSYTKMDPPLFETIMQRYVKFLSQQNHHKKHQDT